MRASDRVLLKHIAASMDTGASSAQDAKLYTLSSGDNVILEPAPHTYDVVIVVPDPGNTETLILKGAGGDTGITLHPRIPSIIALNANFTLNSTGTTTILVRWFQEHL